MCNAINLKTMVRLNWIKHTDSYSPELSTEEWDAIHSTVEVKPNPCTSLKILAEVHKRPRRPSSASQVHKSGH